MTTIPDLVSDNIDWTSLSSQPTKSYRPIQTAILTDNQWGAYFNSLPLDQQEAYFRESSKPKSAIPFSPRRVRSPTIELMFMVRNDLRLVSFFNGPLPLFELGMISQDPYEFGNSLMDPESSNLALPAW